MRVNSRPAGPEIDLGENVWLGVGGRLLTFQIEVRTVEVEDDQEIDRDAITLIGDPAPEPAPGD
jgi:hypothetical protein